VSDRGKNGSGGKDIYIMTGRGKRWSKPVNAGSTVNSEFNEESVRYSAGGDTLWFSSTGHSTTGGYDIFYSVRNQSGGWDKAVNAGYPVNTPWNEFFYLPPAKGDSKFYFVSDRSGGFGGLDIYMGRKVQASSATKGDTVDYINADTLILTPDTLSVITGQRMSGKIPYSRYEGEFSISSAKRISAEGIKSEE
jgi:hypothetical protein